MANEYKKLVLVHGLHPMNEYHFNMIKSLLAHDLKLTPKMQEEYNKIKIANLMEAKFQGPACVDKLIELIKDIPELQDHVKQLKNERKKVARRLKGKTPEKKKCLKEAGPETSEPPVKETLTSGGAEVASVVQKRKANQEKTVTKKNKVSQEQIQPPQPTGASMSTTTDFPSSSTTMDFPSATQSLPSTSSSIPSAKDSPTIFLKSSPKREEAANKQATFKVQFLSPSVSQKTSAQHKAEARSIPHKGPMAVVVLNSTEPFEYECPMKGKGMMFHATVATEREFFHVKVLNIQLKEKFTKMKAITLYDYFECRGILEVNKESFVFEMTPHRIEVPNNIIKKASETPKIENLLKEASGTFVYGLFEFHKKTVNKKNTIYEIQDNTGKIDVVGNGKWHNINCEEGDKFRLYWFQLRKINKKPTLTCGSHSFIQVIRTRKNKKGPSSSATV